MAASLGILREAGHPSLNETLKQHNGVTFKLVKTGESAFASREWKPPTVHLSLGMDGKRGKVEELRNQYSSRETKQTLGRGSTAQEPTA